MLGAEVAPAVRTGAADLPRSLSARVGASAAGSSSPSVVTYVYSSDDSSSLTSFRVMQTPAKEKSMWNRTYIFYLGQPFHVYYAFLRGGRVSSSYIYYIVITYIYPPPQRNASGQQWR
jgi:hypothetical protein